MEKITIKTLRYDNKLISGTKERRRKAYKYNVDFLETTKPVYIVVSEN